MMSSLVKKLTQPILIHSYRFHFSFIPPDVSVRGCVDIFPSTSGDFLILSNLFNLSITLLIHTVSSWVFHPHLVLIVSSVIVMNSLTLLCSILITLCIRLSLFSHSYAASHMSMNLLQIPVYKASSFTPSLQRFFSC